MKDPEVESIKIIEIKKRLHQTDREAYDLIIALEDVIDKYKIMVSKSLKKLKGII